MARWPAPLGRATKGTDRFRPGAEAEVKWPTPQDATDADAWVMHLRPWLESEATTVLAGIRARTDGKPKRGAPKARDLHPAATAWARALAAHFHLLMVITGRNDDGTWCLEMDGAVKVEPNDPGSMRRWQNSTKHQIGSPEGMGAQGPSSIRSSQTAWRSPRHRRAPRLSGRSRDQCALPESNLHERRQPPLSHRRLLPS